MEIKEYSIQELCDKTGLQRRTIHFYSQQGILPPPNGAGLGAYYDEKHLVRLLLIPALRRQGLRLDDIRERLSNMDLESLQALYARIGEASEPAAPKLTGQSYIHFHLPSGMTLIVPAALSTADRKKLADLIETAHRLFS